jgi:TolB protein
MAPAVTRDGRWMAFDSNRTGKGDVWIKDLSSGGERLVTLSDAKEGLPRLTSAGDMIAYRRTSGTEQSVWASAVDGGSPRLLCERCSGPYDWAPDSSGVLVRSAANTSVIELAPIDGSPSTPVLEQAGAVLYEARFSPDGRWIGFHTLASEVSRQIFIAPFHPGRASGPDEWIPITDGARIERNIEWSSDGRVLYFLSERDGSQCIWGQPFDPAAKRPSGEPFEVQHFSGPNRSMVRGGFALSASRGRLYYSLAATRGNVWMLQPAGPTP